MKLTGVYTLACISLALTTRAQSIGFFGPEAEEGSCILVSDPHVRHTGKLVVSGDVLVAKANNGEKSRWHPEQVARLQVGHRRYTSAQGFKVQKGLGSFTVRKPVFVELLDSGRVMLMRYNYLAGRPSMQVEDAAYLLRDAAQSTAVVLPSKTRGSSAEDYYQSLANILGPYLENRPDLRKLLNEDKIEEFQLQRFVHALNTNSYF